MHLRGRGLVHLFDFMPIGGDGFQLDFFSSPEPKAHERANSIPVTPSSVRPSVSPSINIFKHLL